MRKYLHLGFLLLGSSTISLVGCGMEEPSAELHNSISDPSARAAARNCFVSSYPEFLSKVDGDTIVWKDGTRMPFQEIDLSQGFDDLLESSDLAAQMMQKYPRGSSSFAAPAKNFDPGRLRKESFFRKMYGGTESAARSHLVNAEWNGSHVKMTNVNGIAARLTAVSRKLSSRADLRRYLSTAGTFSWRPIEGTRRLSMHSFGIAIDVLEGTEFFKYWKWDPRYSFPIVNSSVKEIVAAFESEGFIWGGKWYHYDPMHFEYRPELLCNY